MPYRVVVSTGSGTKFVCELPKDETLVAEAVDPNQTVTLEWTSLERYDRAEHEARDLDGTAVKRAKLSGKDRIDITDCFRALAEREQLGETEQWYCSKCKQHSRAFKKLDLWSTPEILILHLKRFQYAQNMYFVHRQKLDDLVDFPVEDLDLTPNVLSRANKPSAHYDLFAVSEHSGGMGGGHYTATALDDATNKWFHYNDASVSTAQPASVVSKQAYVLFYRRRKDAPRPAEQNGGNN
mmetsp:Transcript_28256/g.91102  ORF Transcript_28256/g.91102 Transcript_28256/m.91102 type:complete len:239 (-) Transcript_28256:92-808(-)